MSKEEWKPVDGYETRFEISNKGRVRTIARLVKRKKTPHFKDSIIKKQRLIKWGYLTVLLSIDKKYKHFMVHRLVATAFISPRPSQRHFVNHKNGIKTDNCVDNLEWVTVSENHKHAFRTGLRNQNGEKHPSVKLNNKKVIKIFNSTDSATFLSKKYNVSEGTIYGIRTGKRWSHLTGKIYEKKKSSDKSRSLPQS